MYTNKGPKIIPTGVQLRGNFVGKDYIRVIPSRAKPHYSAPLDARGGIGAPLSFVPHHKSKLLNMVRSRAGFARGGVRTSMRRSALPFQ